MENTAHLLPIVLSILFWAGYHIHKDRHLPEPPGHLLLALLLGVGSCMITATILLPAVISLMRLSTSAAAKKKEETSS